MTVITSAISRNTEIERLNRSQLQQINLIGNTIRYERDNSMLNILQDKLCFCEDYVYIILPICLIERKVTILKQKLKLAYNKFG